MKKLLVILGMITCMFCLAACGQEEDQSIPVNEEEAIQLGTVIVEMMNSGISPDEARQYIYIDPSIYESGLANWQSAMKDIGSYDGTNGGTVSVVDDEIVISIEVLGSSHDATVETVLGTNGSYIGITTNVHYSMSEIMAKAGMNTVIGMGTVFAVLILISLIISCFTLISKFEAKQKKEEPAPAAPAPVVPAVPAEEELSDDTELVAVIAAAIAAYEGAASTDGFVVRSIRKSKKSKWQNA